MISFIITLISIALAGLVLVATISYFDGDSLSRHRADIQTTTLVNQATHLSAATALYFNDYGRNPSTLGELASRGYLDSAVVNLNNGSAANWTLAGDYAMAEVTDEATCRALNKRLGFVEPSGIGALLSCSQVQSDAPESICCIPDSTNP